MDNLLTDMGRLQRGADPARWNKEKGRRLRDNNWQKVKTCLQYCFSFLPSCLLQKSDNKDPYMIIA